MADKQTTVHHGKNTRATLFLYGARRKDWTWRESCFLPQAWGSDIISGGVAVTHGRAQDFAGCLLGGGPQSLGSRRQPSEFAFSLTGWHMVSGAEGSCWASCSHRATKPVPGP